MPLRARAALYLAALIGAVPAAAQQPRADTGDIVVTAPEQGEPSVVEVDRQARQITQGGDLLHSPLARFNEWLCPGILGLKEDFAAQMIDRIRWSAEQLHIRLADDTACTPNLIVAFVENGQRELSELAEKNPEMFVWMPTADRKAMLEEPGPVHVWATTLWRSRDGMPMPRRETLDAPPVVSMWMAHSKIYLPVRQDISQVVVLFDREGVRGKTLAQLADYATMRGFAQTKPLDGGQAMDSILSLFDPAAAPPLAMTDFDRAYLASLYRTIPNINGATQIGGINRQLRRQAAAEERAGSRRAE